MGSNVVLDFFREMLNRIFSKSPKFFKVLQIVSGFLTFAGYIPSMLQRWFGIQVPGPTITLCEDVAKASLFFFLGVMLPVQQKPVAQTPAGEPIKVTDEDKMPFTAKAEAKALDQQDPPPPVKEVPNDN